MSCAFEQWVRSCRQAKLTVKLVKKHLDTLNDGAQMLSLYGAELTAEALQAVGAAADVRDYPLGAVERPPPSLRAVDLLFSYFG